MKFAIFFILIVNVVNAQDYYSKVIPFAHENPNVSPNATTIMYFNNDLLISNIYEGSESSLIRIDLEANVLENIIQNDFIFSKDPFTVVSEHLFLYGKDSQFENDTRLRRLNLDYGVEMEKSYLNPGDRTSPLGSISIDDIIYTASITKFDQSLNVRAHIKKVNFEGLVVWENDISEQYPILYPYKMSRDFDSNLLVASAAVTDDNVRHTVVDKINPEGNNLWSFESEEPRVANVAESIISVGDNIVFSNAVDRSDSLEFIENNYNPFPPQLTWLDQGGSFIRNKIFKSEFLTELKISDLKAGNGNYFFGFGRINNTIENISKGWLFKMDLDGNILWEKEYQYPDFDGVDVSTSISDIEELPNGDIVLLIRARPSGSISQIVVSRLNEHGCFGDANCSDGLLLTSSIDQKYDSSFDLKVFPNPSSNTIKFPDYNGDLILKIFDSQGKKYEVTSLSANRIDISYLHPGMYYLILFDNNRVVGRTSFVRQ